MKKVNSPKIQEYDELLSTLLGCINRPAMYGNPEQVELIAKHLSHICFTILYDRWDFHKTQKVWGYFAKKNGGLETFVEVFYEGLDYRSQKWGRNEVAALDIVLRVYQDLWLEFGNTKSIYTKQWIESLLSSPNFLHSPDAVDAILYTLIVSTIDHYDTKENFQANYWTRCQQVNGQRNPGLQDLKTKTSWEKSVRYFADEFSSYEKLKSGLREVASKLQKLKNKVLLDG